MDVYYVALWTDKKQLSCQPVCV